MVQYPSVCLVRRYNQEIQCIHLDLKCPGSTSDVVTACRWNVCKYVPRHCTVFLAFSSLSRTSTASAQPAQLEKNFQTQCLNQTIYHGLLLHHGEKDVSSVGHAGAGVFWDDAWLIVTSRPRPLRRPQVCSE
ncbi:hypothetical protein L210DRAFT_3168071 [Boletus edulis BED1]|uniref:Uncharacterized protein n=1 Tax=Boletus edulis BED1 TaxID=1328754 RepID=A0AAD4BZ77_BOLED|nr:hypothetical protein L210DRAFT_3168071 [Boletus edulis BED1]